MSFHSNSLLKSIIATSLLACLLVITIDLGAQDDTLIVELPDFGETAAIDTSTSNANNFFYRNVPDSVTESLASQKEFAYANDSSYWQKQSEEAEKNDGIRIPAWVEYLLLVLFALILLYAILKIVMSNRLLLFSRKTKQYDEISTDAQLLERTDLHKLIEEAEANSKLRLATRYRFMQLLQDLGDRQLIKLDSKLTNWDYVRQLTTHPLNSKFRYLTQTYDYVWYGEFEPNAEQYDRIRIKFETFIH